MADGRLVRIIGDGVVFSGPCRLTDVIFNPDAANDYADIYDGLDATSGKKLFRMKSAVVITWQVHFTDCVICDVGLYVDGFDSGVETTVVFVPLVE